ncbi:MAG: DUF5682 family protein, partial [Bacteroidota bacterium]
MLIYQPTDFEQVSYYPFAAFSPEWLAIQYGLSKDIPIRFMDLPMSIQYGIQQLDKDPLEELLRSQPQTAKRIIRDPLGYMARLAGYKDSERWWDVLFEQEEEQDIFGSILEMMQALRSGIGRMESAETLRREAFMRKTLRKAQKEGFERIAVVCGAWHSPVLTDLKKYPVSKDNALLRGIKKVRTAATWVPWTYERLAAQSGYGAGVISPAWYELLFHHKSEESSRWMIRAARSLRQEKLDASAAHAMEAVRLAEALASMRHLQLPGMDELKEAAITVLCEGSEAQLQLIERKLIIGEKIGKVSDAIPLVPLQKDLEKAIKSARLTKYWKTTGVQWLKASAKNPRGGIDLREEKDRAKSHLLHRLNLLGISWGSVQKEGRYDKGSFKEYWKLKWKSEFLLQLIAASVWGNTVEVAAEKCLSAKIQSEEQLDQLIVLLEVALYADLPKTMNQLLSQIRTQSAMTQDVLLLMDALPPAIRVLKYGNTRQFNRDAIAQLISELIPRICVGLPTACIQIEDDFALEIITKIQATHTAIHLLQSETYREQWYNCLKTCIQEQDLVQARVEGVIVRLLFDRNVLNIKMVQQKMSYNFSIGNPPLQAVQWVEGFLQGSGLLLIHHAALWQILDDWLAQLADDEFQEVLPLLRRAFSNFTTVERQKMLSRAQHGIPEMKSNRSVVSKQKEQIAAVVGSLLGW